MAYPAARDIIDAVRSNIDRIPLSGEAVDTPSDVAESPTRTIAVSRLLGWVYQGEQRLAASCAAIYMPGLVTIHEDTIANLTQSDVIRPFWAERQDGGGTYRDCLIRTPAENRNLKATGRGPTDQYPALIWDGKDVSVEPAGNTVRLAYLAQPTRISVSNYNSGSDDLSISGTLVPALEMYVTAEACRELEDPREGLYRLLAGRFARPFLRTYRLGTPDQYERGARVNEVDVRTEIVGV